MGILTIRCDPSIVFPAHLLPIVEAEFRKFIRSNVKAQEILDQALAAGNITIRVVPQLDEIDTASWNGHLREILIHLPIEYNNEHLATLRENVLIENIKDVHEFFVAVLFELCNANNPSLSLIDPIHFARADDYARTLEIAEYASNESYCAARNYGIENCGWDLDRVELSPRENIKDYLAELDSWGHTGRYRKHYQFIADKSAGSVESVESLLNTIQFRTENELNRIPLFMQRFMADTRGRFGLFCERKTTTNPVDHYNLLEIVEILQLMLAKIMDDFLKEIALMESSLVMFMFEYNNEVMKQKIAMVTLLEERMVQMTKTCIYQKSQIDDFAKTLEELEHYAEDAIEGLLAHP